MSRGAEERAATEGLAVLLGNSDHSADREAAYLDLFREQRVNGVLLTPTAWDAATAARLAEAGVPVVLVDAEIAGGGVSSVAVDDVEGGRLAVQHLLERGRRRLAFVGGPRGIRQVADRLEGARRALAHMPDATLEVIEQGALTVLHGRRAGPVVHPAAGARDRLDRGRAAARRTQRPRCPPASGALPSRACGQGVDVGLTP